MECSAVDLSEIHRQARAIEHCLSIAERLRDDGDCAVLADEAKRAFVIRELLTIAAHASEAARQVVADAANGEVSAETLEAAARKIDMFEVARSLDTIGLLQKTQGMNVVRNRDISQFVSNQLVKVVEVRIVNIVRLVKEIKKRTQN